MAKAVNFSAINVGARRGVTGTDISLIKRGTVTINPASIAGQEQAELTVTITGAALGDTVILTPPAAFEALIVGAARVSAADTVKFVLGNLTVGAIDAASASWGYTLIRG